MTCDVLGLPVAVTGTGKVEAIHTHPMSIATSTVFERIFSRG